MIIAVWSIVYENSRIDKKYPVYTAKKEQINNDVELDKWFDKWQEKHNVIYYNDFSLVGRWSYIFDAKIDEWIMRYNLLKTNNIPSYSILFDDMPAFWVEVLDIITTELYKANEYKRKENVG